jgi:flagellar basal-body rod protein FlgF
MDRLIYTSISAMRGAMARQASTANNLANASTTGFRAEMSSARAMWLKGEGYATRAQASEEVTAADMKAGVVQQTGRDLDVAIEGDGMLAVQSREGDEAYTRRGDLQLTDSGLLTTADGAPVLGDQGPIALPPADKISIDKSGAIWIVPQGGDPKNPQKVEQLKLVSPAGSKVTKALDGLFRVEGGGALPSDPNGRVNPGSLEGSNVNASAALVDMIDASRAWETQIKLITTAQDLDKSSADLMRLPD